MRGQTHHKRVPLCHENLELVDNQRLRVLAVRLDDGHRVPGDREIVVRVARHVNQPEAVSVGAITRRQIQLERMTAMQRTVSPV